MNIVLIIFVINKLGNQIFRVFSWKLKLHTLLEINHIFRDLKEMHKITIFISLGEIVFVIKHECWVGN